MGHTCPPGRSWAPGLTALLVALLLSAGCVDQKREIARYRDILDAQVPPPPAYEANAPLSFSRALAITSQNNEAISISGENYLQALIQKNRVVAAFLPTVNFQPSYVIQQVARPRLDETPTASSSGTGTPTAQSIAAATASRIAADRAANNAAHQAAVNSGFRTRGDIQYRTELPVVGEINLFRGFGDVASLRAADWTIEQRRQLMLDAQVAVLLNAGQVFYQVLRAERQVEVLRNSLKVQEARVADTEQSFRNGLSTKLAVAQTQAQAAGTRATLVQAEADVANGRSTLAFVMGVSAVDGPLIDDAAVPAQMAAEEELERQAVENRQDLLAAAAAVKAARNAVDVAVSEYYPSVTLNVNAFLYREYFLEASKWNAVLSANLPLFSAGIIEANVRLAWSALRQAALNESELRRQVVTDVRTTYENLITSERRIRELEAEVAAADEALKQAQAALANKLGIELDVLTAQDQLLTAQLLLTGARFDRTVFYLDLLRAAGQLGTAAAAATQPAGEAPASQPAVASRSGG